MKRSPSVVVIEYNASLDPNTPLVQQYDPSHVWDGTDYFGSSKAALCQLGADKGYQHVHTDLTGVNMFFVRSDLAALHFGSARQPNRGPNYFFNLLLHPRHEGHTDYVDPGLA